MKVKRGGAYVDASPFIKRGGVYGAVSALVKSGGGYLAAGGAVEPSDPFEITGVTGTIDHGQTITVTGSGLGQAPTLLRIAGDEGEVGTSVATAAGMTVHGSTGNEWLFESGGTMVLDMQTNAPKTVYKWFDGEAHKDVFLYYERQYFDVGALNPDGNGQIKEIRFTGVDVAGEHTDLPSLGSGWDVKYERLWRYQGLAVDQSPSTGGATRARMEQWSSQIIAGRIITDQTHADFETFADGWVARLIDNSGLVDDATGWGQIFLPFYRSPDFPVSMRARNLIALAGRQRFEIRNNPNPEMANRAVTQYATTANDTGATITLDLTRLQANDGLYLFAINADGEYSAAHEIRPPVVDEYNPLTDNFGVIRPDTPAGTARVNVPEYGAAALAADYVDYEIGFVVDGLNIGSKGDPVGICLTKHSDTGSAYQGHLRIDHNTGDITISPMVNNTKLTIKAASDVHTNLGVRHDWKLRVPKNTGGMIELRNASDDSLIGSVARTSNFDGWHPSQWLYCNMLVAQGALVGKCAYLRAFATTGGVTSTLFDFRFTAEQAGLTSVPSAHDSGVVATIGAALTWGAVPTA